jgi:hypothetical protein
MQHITKLCADHLRAFVNDNHGVKLKASHAHELVAAFFGYKSRAALLADTRHLLSNLRQAKILVLEPTAPIDQRRQSLQELPADLPNTYGLTEGVYGGLIAEKWMLGKIWPTYETLATFLADEYIRQQGLERVYRYPIKEGVKVQREDDSVQLIVLRFYQIPLIDGGVQEVDMTTIIKLTRVAGHIGYADPEISVKIEDLGMRR